MVVAVSETFMIGAMAAASPVFVAILALLIKSKRAVEQVHLLVNDRLDKVLKANELLVKANEELVGTVADLKAHIVASPGTDLSASEHRAIARAGQVPPLSQTLQSTPPPVDP